MNWKKFDKVLPEKGKEIYISDGEDIWYGKTVKAPYWMYKEEMFADIPVKIFTVKIKKSLGFTSRFSIIVDNNEYTEKDLGKIYTSKERSVEWLHNVPDCLVEYRTVKINPERLEKGQELKVLFKDSSDWVKRKFVKNVGDSVFVQSLFTEDKPVLDWSLE